MITNKIDLREFLSKGNVVCEFKDNVLNVATKRAIPTQRFDKAHLSINSYVFLQSKIQIPLTIDVVAKIDAPGLYLLLGNGHINFGTMWSDNRRIDDILEPTRKTAFFHNHIPMDQFNHITLKYDYKEMQILVNGEERYYSKKEQYMKSKVLSESNRTGFEFGLGCDKLVNLVIESVSITQHQDTCGIVHSDQALPTPIMGNQCFNELEKPTFEKCLSLLSPDIQDEIVRIDKYLKGFEEIKFKRQIEKHGNKITYIAADYGFSYAIYLSNDIFDHSLQWYIITNGKPDTWHRKADMMEELLDRLSKKMPDFAERMFSNLDDCVGCYPHCLAKTKYQLNGNVRLACHGKLKFTMNRSGFDDLRLMIEEIKG